MKGAYAVFGAGSFGSKVATELSEAGHHVVVIDRDREAVSAIREKVTEALVADVSNPDVIRELDVKKFDAVIMGMSSHFEDLILALTLVKQEGAKNIYVKSNSDIQQSIVDVATGKVEQFARLDSDGLHVGEKGKPGEVLIDSDSVDVRVGGKVFSSFGDDYVEFGNQQMRRTSDGGIAFVTKDM